MTHELAPIRLVEPPVIAMGRNDDLTVWRYPDGSVVVRIGPPDQIGAETFEVSRHHLYALSLAFAEAADML